MLPPDYPEEALYKLLNEVLTSIERREFKLLNWNFVDVKSDLKTLMPQILEELPEPGLSHWIAARNEGVTAEDIFEELVRRYLIVKDGLQKHLYRSRFAETIRLLFLLRQRFSNWDWQTASRLVSDIKLDVQPRRYPRRDVSADELINQLHDMGAPPLYREAVARLLMKDGERLSLARFQQEAVLEQYRVLHSGRQTNASENAVVVGAGTGAGKTKAFYIPALAEIAASLKHQPYVQALAIYPRVELLKDQLAEAFLEARKLDKLLQQRNRHIIRIGAYYGDTPHNTKAVLANLSKVKTAQGRQEAWQCSFFLCPECRTHALPLLWHKEDIVREQQNIQRNKQYGIHAILHCRTCYFHTEPGQLVLTRDQFEQDPPDILFTTTEMLNRCLSQTNKHKLIGVETDNPPRLLLLDEIHTYEGLQGAHIAYLLRRWRHARRYGEPALLCCVGLSATLKSAETFFAKLTGIPTYRVKYVHPTDEDMEVEGAEYNVMLKSDPVSGASLLSTSVQTAMLLGRMLDPRPGMPSGGFYGKRIFSFADKLDVVNRWAYTLNDAERNRLSRYRLVLPGESVDTTRQKQQAGQIWQTSEDIGYYLNERLRVTMTTSQRPGVNPDATIVLATSALEVGFNDPQVGAVLQHRAPHSPASFLQRKGRAGRIRQMRPWMVTVTSDYGHDRWTFQHAEQFFQPDLKEIDLPINNYYVRKMQAAFALMDWLALTIKHTHNAHNTNIWDLLSGERQNPQLQNWRTMICKLIKAVLDGTQREAFSRYLQQALGIEEQSGIDSLLWDEPRSLLFDVLPTLLRQLESSWQQIKLPDQGESTELQVISWADNVSKYPMPNFVTPTLFSDLNSPGLPVRFLEEKTREETLPLIQCLTEFAPGNASKRYSSNEAKDVSHWLVIPETAIKQEKLIIETLKESLNYDDVPTPLLIDEEPYQLYRPRSYTVKRLPKEIANTSSAHLIWCAQFRPQQLLTEGETPDEDSASSSHSLLSPHSRWRDFFSEIHSYTQASGSWVEIARLATGVQVETRYTSKREPQRRWLQFTANDQPAGIGYVNYFDALCFRLHPLDVTRLTATPQWNQHYQTLGPEYFLYKMCQDSRVQLAKLSHFEITRLCELELSMLVIKAIEQQCSLAEAASLIRTQRPELADTVMHMIFQGQQTEEEDEERVGRLHEKLSQLLEDEQLQSALEDCERVLWEPHENQFFTWLQDCYASSIGSALFATLVQLAPDIDPDDLTLDIDGDHLWISENTPGGIGIISRIAEVLEFKPHDFDLQMLDTLQYCKRQQLANQLDMITEFVAHKDPQLLAAFANLRRDSTITEQEALLETLRGWLEQRGITTTRELMIALRAKFLRPNSGKDTDVLISALVHFWHEQEERLSCKIDLRVITTAILNYPLLRSQVEQVLKRISGVDTVEGNQIFNILQSLLWLSCSDSCPDCIEKRQYYQEQVKPSRALLVSLLQLESQVIRFGEPDWEQQFTETLSTFYSARVSCSQEQLAACQILLMDLLEKPIEIGYQHFYPVVDRVTRTGYQWTISMGIREFAHA